MIYYQKIIKRQDLKNNPNCIFVFGDNLQQKGYGGQAAEMRDEPNAVGIPTKKNPSMSKDSFFNDNDYDKAKDIILTKFKLLESAVKSGKLIIWPADDIGTGLAQLDIKAPKIFNLIQTYKNLISS